MAHIAMSIPNGVVSPTALGKQLGVSRQRAEQILHRDKGRARNNLNKALKAGRITKPDICQECGVKGTQLQAHHDDYSMWRQVRWLCSACHARIHPHAPRATKQYICSSCGNDVVAGRKLCDNCKPVSMITRQCAQCGHPFDVARSQIRLDRHAPRIYCSRQCFWASRYVLFHCAQCGKDVKRRKCDMWKGPTGVHFCGHQYHREWNGVHLLRALSRRPKPNGGG